MESAKRVNGCVIGLEKAFILACSFVSRVETKQILSVLRFFKHLLVVLKHLYFLFFVSVDFCCCYALVCILQCCLLPSTFVILMSR